MQRLQNTVRARDGAVDPQMSLRIRRSAGQIAPDQSLSPLTSIGQIESGTSQVLTVRARTSDET